VKLSVARFLLWIGNAKFKVHQAAIPIDILMVWHAFMLNTAEYSEFVKSQTYPYLDEGFVWQELVCRLPQYDRIIYSSNGETKVRTSTR
jgi:hypothetical protein